MAQKVDQENKKEKQYSGQSFKFIMAAMLLMLIVSVATVITFTMMMRISTAVDEIQDINYEQHYVFIVDDKDSPFWVSVYEAANKVAISDHIYLEDLSETLGVNYTEEDLLRIAVNSSVDGIIYGGSSSEQSVALINRAVNEGIGVVVLQKDIESSRQCFVGVNNYELGQIYGSQILSATDNESLSDTKLEILIDGDMSEGAINILILGIEDYISANSSSMGASDIASNIVVTRIYANDIFSVDEVIRNMFLESEELPDVMICLSNMYTQCVYQSLVDYNKVGETVIIGYYADESTLDAIDKQIIHSTVTIDTSEMGVASIKALEEYHTHGYTSSFVSVGTEVYDIDNVHTVLEYGEVNAGD